MMTLKLMKLQQELSSNMQTLCKATHQSIFALEGHADERGTREYNLALGENRALSVKEVLGLYNLR